LLSKVDIFDIRNNLAGSIEIGVAVVNCSQRLISLIFGTTNRKDKKDKEGCELLSKVDIFDIRNNFMKLHLLVKAVVNCSQRLISLIFGTTRRLAEPHPDRL